MASSPVRPGVMPAYLAAYVFLDWVSYANHLGPVNITPWNPPPGLSLVLVLLFGARAAPLLLIAALAADVIVRDVTLYPWASLAADASIAGIYAAAGMALRRLAVDPALPRQRHLVAFLSVGVVAALAAATVVVSIFLAGGAVAPGQWKAAVFRYWVGDAVGIAVTSPLLLLAMARRLPPAAWRRFLTDPHMLAEVAAVAVVLWVVFRFNLSGEFRIVYPVFIPMVWIALRHGLGGAALAALGMQLGLTITLHLSAYADERVTEMQFALLAMTVTSLLVGVVVSERRRGDAILRGSEARLRSLFSVVPVGIMEIDGDRRVRSVNPAFAGLMGAGADDPVGRLVAQAFPALGLDQPQPARELALPAGADGLPRWLEVAVADAGGGDRSLIAVVRDVSERKRFEQRRQAHHAEVARISRANSAGQLAAALAHELNQPLASVIYYGRASQRFLKTADGAAEAGAAIDKAVAEALRAGEIIRNLRNFLAPREAEAIRLDLREVVREACDLLSVDLRSQAVELSLVLDAAPLAVSADRGQIEQVLINLSRNAIEAMAEVAGPRRLVVAAYHHDGAAVVEVSDTGPGVPPELEADLFKPFVTGKRGGMGLGLTISQSIAEAAGGSLAVKTGAGAGASFLFSLPIAAES